MSVNSIIPSLPNGSSPRKFLGRKAKPCPKCRGIAHYVNRIGGISCETCIPPREGYSLFRLTITGGMWDDADDPFGVPDGQIRESTNSGVSKNDSGASQASPAESCRQSATQTSSKVVKRDQNGNYAAEEIEWFVRPGGVIDQMDRAGRVTPYRIPTCRSGETAGEAEARLAAFHGTNRTLSTDHSADFVPAVLAMQVKFVIPYFRGDRPEKIAAGTTCRMFVGRDVHPDSSVAVAIRGDGRPINTIAVVDFGFPFWIRAVMRDQVRLVEATNIEDVL